MFSYIFIAFFMNIEQKYLYKMKQQVINYEFDILHNELIQKCSAHKLVQPYRYENWRLSQTIYSLINYSSTHELKWMGNSHGSWIVAYFYALLKVCMQKDEHMIKFKYSLYKLCQYCLNLSEQKLLIELLNIIQKQKPLLASFLSRNPQLQELLLNIFQSSSSDCTDDCFKTLINYTNNYFNFVALLPHPILQDVLQISHKDLYSTIFIVREFDCYFILDVPKQKIGFVNPPKIREFFNFSDHEEDQALIMHPENLSSVHSVRQAFNEKQPVNKCSKFIPFDHKLLHLKQTNLQGRKERRKFDLLNVGQKEQKNLRNNDSGCKGCRKPYFLKKNEEKSKQKSLKEVNKKGSQSKSPRIEVFERTARNTDKSRMIGHHHNLFLNQKKIKSHQQEGFLLEKVLSARKIKKHQGYKSVQQNSLQHCSKKDHEKLMISDHMQGSNKYHLQSDPSDIQDSSSITPFLHNLI